jgi:hypothetical protein
MRKRYDGGASQSQMLKGLQKVPDRLQELMGAVLNSPDDALLCTMRWMLFAQRPLGLEELYFAIRTGTGQLTSGYWDISEVNRDSMEAFILASSRGLVEIKTSGSLTRAQLVHESVREFLITGGSTDLGPCSDRMVAADSHFKLFTWCQMYLRSNAKEQVATNEDRYIRSRYDVRKTFPLLHYAGESIFHHFEVSYLTGILHLHSLREFPLQQSIYLTTFYDPKLHQQLLEPHRLFTSLLYLSICRGCAELAGGLVAEKEMHSSRSDAQDRASATASAIGLLADGIDLNCHFEDPWSSVLELATERCPGLVQSLLDQGADVNIDGGAPLCTAANFCNNQDGMEGVVLLLLSRGAYAQAFRSNSDMTALTLAVNNGNLATVTVLPEHGADAIGAYNSTVVSPLLLALGHVEQIPLIANDEFEIEVEYGPVHDHIMRVLLDHGADVHLRAGPKQISPLQFAAEYRHDDIVQLLTGYGQRDPRDE